MPSSVTISESDAPANRAARMVAAASWLAEQRFARIGWADASDGKGPKRRWQSDATDDPMLVPALLAGARNSLVIPTGRGLVIDVDEPKVWDELERVGLPPTLRVASPTPGHGHAYGLVPEGVDMALIPGTFAGGELRRLDPITGTSSMVLGPWSRTAAGTYEPLPGPRELAVLPVDLIDYLRASARRQDAARARAAGPADPDWTITAGRHDYLVARARHLRGVGMTGERLLEELVRLDRERCRPPLADVPGRGLAELRLIAEWTMAHIGDDRPADLEAVPSEAWPEPEDRGHAVPSALGGVSYVEDLVRPGRILVVAATEGSGKSYAITGELGIRLAAAGGAFAGAWPVVARGAVLVLSEMHADDDHEREETVVGSLGITRAHLAGAYYRLPLQLAAGQRPPLMVDAWRSWVTDWMRAHGVILLVVDTATRATQVDPWGREIQQVYQAIAAMLDRYPELAVALVVHMKKPQGRGGRGIDDVLGEWGRWNDVTLTMEDDGAGRTKLTTYKRVRRPRRIVATREDGLLVGPVDVTAGPPPRVADATIVDAVTAQPGLTFARLGAIVGVQPRTAGRYARRLAAAGRLVVVESPTPARVYLGGSAGYATTLPAESPESTSSQAVGGSAGGIYTADPAAADGAPAADQFEIDPAAMCAATDAAGGIADPGRTTRDQ